jgi:16S rRNA (guanine527-N7)-methyltransferase
LKSPTSNSNSHLRQLLESGAQRLSISLSADQLAAVEFYLSLLSEYNQHTNLVSNAEPDVVVREHVIDALTLVPQVGQCRKLVDIGSGAGFPGLILSIACANLQVHLIDSIGKKTKFLTQVAQRLGLQDRVVVHTARAEELAHEKSLRGSFDAATARAVGKLDLLCELALPFLQVGGVLLAQKSRQQAELELPAAQPALQLLGGEHRASEAPNMEATGRDLLVVTIAKVRATPDKYPRHGSQLKRPLSAGE